MCSTFGVLDFMKTDPVDLYKQVLNFSRLKCATVV